MALGNEWGGQGHELAKNLLKAAVDQVFLDYLTPGRSGNTGEGGTSLHKTLREITLGLTTDPRVALLVADKLKRQWCVYILHETTGEEASQTSNQDCGSRS